MGITETQPLLRETKIQVAREIQKFLQENPDKKWHHYFNNWKFRLVDSKYNGWYRYLVIKTKKWDIAHSLLVNPIQQDILKLTDLYKNQTPREYFTALDNVIEEEGLDLNFISETLGKMYSSISQTDKYTNKIHSLTYMAFVKMRAKGYSYHELTS